MTAHDLSSRMQEAAASDNGGAARPSFMRRALELAERAMEKGEVPVGAVLVDSRNSEIIAAFHNQTERLHDPTAHAEILAIREACRALGSARLPFCDLYVTLEPCAMCACASAHARLRRIYFGAYDAKGGGVEHGARIFAQPTCHHRPEIIGGVEATVSEALLKGFFAAKRE